MLKKIAIAIAACFALLSLLTLIWSVTGEVALWWDAGSPWGRLMSTMGRQTWMWFLVYAGILCCLIFGGNPKGVEVPPDQQQPREALQRARISVQHGCVMSPYAPYATIDVRGLKHGIEVLDPVSKRIFINP